MTKTSLEPHLYQILDNKQNSMSINSDIKQSNIDFIDTSDEVTLSFAELKASIIENPLIDEKLKITSEIINLLNFILVLNIIVKVNAKQNFIK